MVSLVSNYSPMLELPSADDDGIGSVVFSQNDSVTLFGTGQAAGNGSIYAYSKNGSMLWCISSTTSCLW